MRYFNSEWSGIFAAGIFYLGRWDASWVLIDLVLRGVEADLVYLTGSRCKVQLIRSFSCVLVAIEILWG